MIAEFLTSISVSLIKFAFIIFPYLIDLMIKDSADLFQYYKNHKMYSRAHSLAR